MEANKILSSDVLDILFEGKNKDYGAYDLRKTYNKRITKALIITAAIALLALLGSVLASSTSGSSKKKVKMQDVNLQDIKQEEKKIEPPPPPPPIPNRPLVVERALAGCRHGRKLSWRPTGSVAKCQDHTNAPPPTRGGCRQAMRALRVCQRPRPDSRRGRAATVAPWQPCSRSSGSGWRSSRHSAAPAASPWPGR